MGQQQLLLLVLATVVVGLATVAGIQAFDRGEKQFDRDARRQVAADILSDFKGLVNKPSELGGVDWKNGDEAFQYWSAQDREVEVLKRMGYDVKGGSDGAVVPLENSGHCRFDVIARRYDENTDARVDCWDPSGARKHRVTAFLNRYGNGEIRIHD